MLRFVASNLSVNFCPWREQEASGLHIPIRILYAIQNIYYRGKYHLKKLDQACSDIPRREWQYLVIYVSRIAHISIIYLQSSQPKEFSIDVLDHIRRKMNKEVSIGTMIHTARRLRARRESPTSTAILIYNRLEPAIREAGYGLHVIRTRPSELRRWRVSLD